MVLSQIVGLFSPNLKFDAALNYYSLICNLLHEGEASLRSIVNSILIHMTSPSLGSLPCSTSYNPQKLMSIIITLYRQHYWLRWYTSVPERLWFRACEGWAICSNYATETPENLHMWDVNFNVSSAPPTVGKLIFSEVLLLQTHTHVPLIFLFYILAMLRCVAVHRSLESHTFTLSKFLQTFVS